MPSTDSGIDLILGNGKRLQVKSSMKADATYSYTFNFKSYHKKEGYYIPHNLKEVDYIVLWAVNDDVFFIIPSEIIRSKLSVKMWTDTHRETKYTKFRGRWELLNEKSPAFNETRLF